MPIPANVIDIEAFRSPPVRVERWPHPDRPHCICFCISGDRSADVQAFITSLDAEIDNHGAGFAASTAPTAARTATRRAALSSFSMRFPDEFAHAGAGL